VNFGADSVGGLVSGLGTKLMAVAGFPAEIDDHGQVNRQSRGLRMHSGEEDDVQDFLTWWWLWRCLALANLQDSGWLK